MEVDAIKKPLILLYPTALTPITVRLTYGGNITATFPSYHEDILGWSGIVDTESIFHDSLTHMETYGIFWEGVDSIDHVYDLSKGFVVRGSEIQEFLYEKLRYMNLSVKEYSDFIMFWYPKLQEYPYVQITFAGEDYTDYAKLDIIPTPDEVFRVFMIAKPLNHFEEIPPQELPVFERKGFHVIEWGGTILGDTGQKQRQ